MEPYFNSIEEEQEYLARRERRKQRMLRERKRRKRRRRILQLCACIGVLCVVAVIFVGIFSKKAKVGQSPPVTASIIISAPWPLYIRVSISRVSATTMQPPVKMRI